MDAVVEDAFPYIRLLFKIYIISNSEAVVECMFSKMGLIMTKKRCSLENDSLDMLNFLMIFDGVFENL